MNRRIRRLSTAFVAMLVLLMSQLAVAAHVCSMAGSHVQMSAMDADDCSGPAGANMCDQHCQFGHAAVDPAKPVPALDVTTGPSLNIQHTFPVPGLALRSPRETPPPPQPPPAIRFSVLRI